MSINRTKKYIIFNFKYNYINIYKTFKNNIKMFEGIKFNNIRSILIYSIKRE